MATLIIASCTKPDPMDDYMEPPVIMETPVTSIGGTDYFGVLDQPYGLHEREVVDILHNNSNIVDGVVILFHGGAYVQYDKDTIYTSEYAPLVKNMLDNNITIVNASYKYLDSVGLANPISSGGAVIDAVVEMYPNKNIVVAGVSAGAGIALYNTFVTDIPQVTGVVALDAQDLDVRQWEEVFPELNVDLTLQIPQFAMLYAQLYGATDSSNWGLEQYMDEGDPAVFIENSVDRPFSLLDIDNLYHNVGHATVLASQMRDAGIEVTEGGDLLNFIKTRLNE